MWRSNRQLHVGMRMGWNRFQVRKTISKILHILVALSMLLTNLGGVLGAQAADDGSGLAAAPEVNLDDPEPTPTATPGLVIAPSDPPTATPTRLPGETPTPDPVVLPTETPEPGLVITATATLTSTPVLKTPTASPTPSPEPPVLVPITTTILVSETVQLTLSADPIVITPGRNAFTDWEIEGLEIITGIAELIFYLPNGFAPHASQDGIFDPEAMTLTLAVDKTSGRMHWRTDGTSWPTYLIEAALRVDDEILTVARLALIDHTSFVIKKSGGQAVGLDGRVTVIFPENALSEDIDLYIRNTIPTLYEHNPPSGQPFEITAQSQATGLEVDHFNEPITITVQYDEMSLWGDESGLKLVYFNEDEQSWFALPSRVDTENNILYGFSDHFSAFDFDILTWQTPRPPTLDSFQVTSFTGAATYQTSFWMPPGPAGLQPNISLSYNSQVASSTGWRSQASWVGMGWSLDGVSYIQRNMNGTDKDLGDDVFQLVISGASYSLLPVVDANAPTGVQVYHTAAESFLRVWAYNPTGEKNRYSYWRVWAQDGTQYFFGYNSSDRAEYPFIEETDQYPYCDYDGMRNWYWGLSKQVSIHGQELTYTYSKETVTKWFCDNANHSFDHAIYPDTITYPNGLYQVQFVRENRSDYESGWTGSDSYVLYDTKRLDKILVWQDSDLNGTFETVIRRYELSYVPDTSSSGHIFPGRSYASGTAYRTTLASVQEFADNTATESLPATNFTYDYMHLTRGENGYGGAVEFSYAVWYHPWGYPTNYQFSSLDPLRGNFVRQINECSGTDTNPPDDWQGEAECVVGTDNIVVHGHTARHSAYLELPVNFLKPGNSYYVYIDGSSKNANLGANEIGLTHGGGTWLQTIFDMDDYRTGTYDEFVIDTTIRIPANAQYLRMYVICSECEINEFYVAKVTTQFPVNQKEIFDGTTLLSAIDYSYDEPAVNDWEHSTAVRDAYSAGRPDKLLAPRESNFRGHAATIEKSPDGLIKTTYFHQDDTLNGRASVTTLTSQTFTDNFDRDPANVENGQWDGSDPTYNQTILDALGDSMLQNYSPNSTYLNFNRATNTLRDQSGWANTAMLQFQVRDATASAIYRLYNNTNNETRVFSLIVEPGGGGLIATTQVNKGSTWAPVNQSLDISLYEDTWYVLLLMVDDTDGFYLRIWERNNPANVAHYQYDMEYPGKAWQFRSFVKNGISWLDEYAEGRLYSIQTNFYAIDAATPTQSSTFATIDGNDMPHSPNGFFDLDQISWIRQSATVNLNFDGDASFTGTRVEHEYNTTDYFGSTAIQYGNLTRTIKKYWDGSAWVAYRASKTRFYPVVSQTQYLISLPTNTNQYTCESDGVCDYATGDITASVRYIYDQNNNFSTAPSTGILTGQRTQICWTDDEFATSACTENGSPVGGNYARFSDQTFTYDTYGNLVATRAYQDWGTKDGLNLTNRSYTETSVGYDSNYHTYAVATINALNHRTETTYDYALGLPESVTDANGNTTTAAYDGLGRMTAICYPWDTCTTTPSIQLEYFTGATGFYTEATQKLNATETIAARKFYNGLGQLLQSQTIGVDVNGTLQDIIVDYTYDENGRVSEQTVPYAVATNRAEVYYQSAIEQAHTSTSYDILGRVAVITATDSTTQTYAYDGLTTVYTDARRIATETTVDDWGRTILVEPANGPSVAYTYDTLNQLLSTTYGDAVSEIKYNQAGQKTDMDDPDMGNWSYTYSPLGQLINQTDARGCSTTLDYDLLGRLTGKSYTGSCGDISMVPPAYTFDGNTLLDDFSAGIDLTEWDINGTVSVSNKEVIITGDSAWSLDLSRDELLGSNTEIHFSFLFESGTGSTQYVFYRGDYGTPDYRRWSLVYSSGNLSLRKYVGTSSTSVPLIAATPNTWYDASLVLDDDGKFQIHVWQSTNPAVIGSYTETFTDSYWLDESWTFGITNYTGTTRFDNYQESKVHQLGLRTAMNDASGTTTWDYDVYGRLIQETRNITHQGTFVTQWGDFDLAGRAHWMSYPGGPDGSSGEQVDFTYHPQGTIESVVGDDTYLYNAAYDEAGRLDLLEMGYDNSVLLTTDYEYFDWNTANGAGRLMGIETTAVGLNTVQDLRYYTGSPTSPTSTYDALGNILEIYDHAVGGTSGTPQVQTFTYDDLNRLESAKAENGVNDNGDYDQETYTYNANTGNLANKAGVALTYDASVTGCVGGSRNIPHAVSQAVDGSDTYNYAYDCNGNQVQRVTLDNTYAFTYDAENRLVAVEKDNSVIAAYVYDGDGRQVIAQESERITAYVGSHFEASFDTPADGGYWKFDEETGTTAIDATAYRRDGTISGAQRYVDGHSNQALDFDGLNDYIGFTSEPQIQEALTVGAWVRPEVAPTGKGRVVVSTYRWNGSSAAQRGWMLGDVWGSVDEFCFCVYSPSGAGGGANLPNFFSTYLNQWVYVTGVYKPGVSVALYVNGVKVAEDTSDVPLSIGLSGSFRIGSRADNTLQGNWNGQIDEVEIIARAMSADEIAALFNGETDSIASTEQDIRTYYFAGAQRVAMREKRSQTIGEVGQVATLTNSVQTIMLEHSYTNPVVFAQPLSNNEADAAVVRITDVQNDRFSFYVQEAPNQDGNHVAETVSYLVLEAGSWAIETGSGTLQLEVGTVQTAATQHASPNSWATVNFPAAFSSTPVVISQVQSNNDTHWVKTRQTSVGTASFRVALEEDEVQTAPHGTETIGWLAIEGGSGEWLGHAFLAGTTGDSVTSSWYSLSLSAGSFSSAPRFLAQISTQDGYDTCGLRYQNLTSSGVQVRAEEDTTYDAETSHTTEVVSFLAIEGDGLIGINVNRLYFLPADHLGSTSQAFLYEDGSLTQVSAMLYKPWGEVRYDSGMLPTDFTYTGQRSDSYIKLSWYGSRWYDPALGRFTQPDTIVPVDVQGTQAFDRYAYVNNSPINFTDPDGHLLCSPHRPCEPTNQNNPTSPLITDKSEAYSDWNSNKYSGCFKCHTAVAYGEVALINEQLAQAHQNMTEWAAVGYTPMLATTMVVGGAEIVGFFGMTTVAEATSTTTTLACADGDCTNEIRTVQNGITVLGRNPAYVDVADDIGGNILKIPSELFRGLSPDQFWDKFNKPFIDAAVTRGDYFYLASKWAEAEIGSMYWRELNYLFELGYTISTNQTYLVPPP